MNPLALDLACAAAGLLVGGGAGLAVALSLYGRVRREQQRTRELEDRADRLAEAGQWRELALTALDAVPDWVVRATSDGRILESNRPTARHLPFDRSCVGRRLVELVPDHAAGSMAQHVERAARTGKPLKLEYLHEQARAYVETRIYPLPGGELLVVTRDLTDQKLKEENLHRGKARYALAIQGANDGLWDWDLEAGSIYYSYAWKQLMGLAPEDPADDPAVWFERVHPEDLTALRGALDAHLEGRAPRFESEHRILHGDGRASWVLARGMAVRDATGRAQRIAGSLTDLTNRRVVAVTQEKADLLEHATNSVGIGVAVLLADGSLARSSRVLQEMAREWEDLTAWWRDVRRNLTPPPQRRCPSCGEAEHVGTTLAELISPDSVVVRRDGEGALRVYEIAWAGHAHEIGEAHATVLLVKDVTDSVLAHRRLERLNGQLVIARDQALAASRAKSAFLANMSHELRTPLNHVIGYAEMLGEELEERGIDELSEDVARIRTSSMHLLELIAGILDLSRLEAGMAGLEVASFPLGPLLARVTEAARHEVQQRNNGLELDLPDEPGEMVADEGQLERILRNLLSNAAKFTRDGTVTLSLHQQVRSGRDELCFRVADTGIGMDSDQLARIAEGFYMGDSSSTREAGGAGLGLTLVWRFTEMMGGHVSVASVPGEGSTFEVVLPRRVQLATPAAGGAGTRRA